MKQSIYNTESALNTSFVEIRNSTVNTIQGVTQLALGMSDKLKDWPTTNTYIFVLTLS